jgi:hypothetical protein
MAGAGGTASAASAASSTPGQAGTSASVAGPAPGDKALSKTPGKDTSLDALAKSLHVSTEKLLATLRDVKQLLGRTNDKPLDPAVVALVEHDLGVNADQARALLTKLFGDRGPGSGGKKGSAPTAGQEAQFTAALAKALGISESRAAGVVAQLDQLAKSHGGVSPSDPRFAALAASLHLTSQGLADAIATAKRSLADTLSTPSPSGS